MIIYIDCASILTTRINLLCSKSARIPRGGDATGTPFAYLNYLVFNEQYVAVDGGAWRVPQTAGFNPGQEAQGYTEANNKVKFGSPVTINQTGYIYVWVSNETEATKVWFDDLSVVHRKNIVSQATDYETWGGVLREQKYNEDENYRYGYQGKYAERDEETGWNHFELREYDPVIGRWTTKDPEGQYYSPYVAMGNDPVDRMDPDGGKDGPGEPGKPVLAASDATRLKLKITPKTIDKPNTRVRYTPGVLDGLDWADNLTNGKFKGIPGYVGKGEDFMKIMKDLGEGNKTNALLRSTWLGVSVLFEYETLVAEGFIKLGQTDAIQFEVMKNALDEYKSSSAMAASYFDVYKKSKYKNEAALKSSEFWQTKADKALNTARIAYQITQENED